MKEKINPIYKKNIKSMSDRLIHQGKKVAQGVIALVLLLGFQWAAQAQTLRYPANITPVLTTPYSLFLSDYTDPLSNHLSATVLFNDFNETQWDFRFRLTIESADIRLTTSPSFIPSQPLTVTPGAPVLISSEDWAPYFDYNHLIIEGQSKNDLIRSGRLPEGFYSFCIEVLDYETGDPLSRQSCASAWIQLNETARIISPQCGKYMDPKQVQIPFQWQLFQTQSPNAIGGITHQLTIWEMTDGAASPLSAVANGQALQVFQSDIQTSTTYMYGPADPALELGKHYVYRVQSFDPEGRDSFKNNGYSEFCDFHYGWPTGGQIKLLFPLDEGGFRRREVPVVEWTSVDNMISGQRVSYDVQIGEMEESETPDENIHFDDLWYHKEILPSTFTYDRKAGLYKLPQITKKYIWRVIAYTGDQEVGRSGTSVFYGPPLVERFYAGGHKVWVDAISHADLDSLCGVGRVRFSPDANDWTDVRFRGLKLKDNGGYFVLDQGEIYHDLDDPLITALQPKEKSNLASYFHLERYKVDHTGISVYGNIQWDLPFATTSGKKAIVQTDHGWMLYNNFKVNGALNIHEESTYELLDPYKFTLDLYPSSMVYVNTNNYWFIFEGHLALPENVKGTTENERVLMPFFDEDQLFYMENEDPQIVNYPSILNKARMDLRPSFFTIDLSDTASPERFATDKTWKGVYFNGFTLRYNDHVDESGQIVLDGTYDRSYSLTANGDKKAWVTSQGLDFKLKDTFEASHTGKFNTFPSKLNDIQLDIQHGRLTGESWLKGQMIIPFISETKNFTFTIPISNLGFRSGYLDQLDNTSFTFNEDGGEQRLDITIRRAVFADNNRLNMTIDVGWPALKAEMKSLVGFKAWGDYNIGFNVKNGALPLVKRLQTDMNGYPVVVHTIGAGGGDGNYSFATTLDVQLGNDVSGGKGSPQVNVYSVQENKYAPKGKGSAAALPSSDQPQESPEEQIVKINQEYENQQADLQEKLLDSKEGALASAESLKKSLVNDDRTSYEVTEIYSGPGFEPVESSTDQRGGLLASLSQEQKEQLDVMVSEVVGMLAAPLTKKIDEQVNKVRDSATKKISEVEDKAVSQIETQVDALVNTVADAMASSLQNDKIDVAGPINDIARVTSNSIKREVVSSFRLSVKENIRKPLVTLLDDGIRGRVNKMIVGQGAEIVYTVLEGGDADISGMVSGMGAEVSGVVTDVAKDALDMVSPDKLSETVQALAMDFVSGIDPGVITHDISAHMDKVIKKAFENALKDKVNEQAAKLANEVLDMGNMDIEVPLSFDQMGRLAQGDIKGVFAADPVPVNLNTPVISLNGYINYTPDDPVFGDVWSGDILMTVKVPTKFALNALYFNGKKGDTNYWFCQIDPKTADQAGGLNRQPGDVLSKDPRALENPVSMGAVSLVGITGRLYHHMKEQQNGTIQPDPAMNYGAYLNAIFFDQKTGGTTMRLQVSGEVNSQTNGDYTLEFNGLLHVLGANTVEEGAKNANVMGALSIKYNSRERHFLGYAQVVLKTEALCANGSLLVDTKPGKWRVALGSRDDRLRFIPGCVGITPTGWLDINEYSAELGLGIDLSLYVESPTIGLGFVKFYAAVDARAAIGLVARVRYSPRFSLMRAGVWQELYVGVGVHYKWAGPFSRWKTINLVEIYVRGDMLVIFEPSPTTLTGDLRGHIKVLCFSKDFHASITKTLK